MSIGIARRGDEMLVAWVNGDDGAAKGCRPPGGGVEFGEVTTDALAREFREEFGTGIRIVGTPAVLENLYVHEGVPGHEIVFAYPVQLESAHVYERDEIQVYEGCEIHELCTWHPIEAFVSGAVPLYPDGIKELLLQLLPPE